MSFRQYISDQVGKLATPAGAEAYRNLVGLSAVAIPHLIEEFWHARDADVRARLVYVLGQFQEASTIDFLIDAMGDVHEQTWMNALDGLIAIGGEKVMVDLTRFASSLNPDDIRGAWIIAAFEQINDGSTG